MTRDKPCAHRLPKHRKHPVTSLLPADMREAEEVEGLGLPLTAPRSVVSRKWAELQEAGLFGVQLQSELAQSFAEFFQNRSASDRCSRHGTVRGRALTASSDISASGARPQSAPYRAY